MTENEIRTIGDLFEKSPPIRIPAYQRAYSWERKHCEQYLQDLKEQNHRYYLGQFLFETDEKCWYIVDGQQRMTTTVLFMAALAKNEQDKHEPVEGIKSRYLSGKFSTIEDDIAVFEKIISTFNTKNIIAHTNSQRNLKKAFEYFDKELKKYYIEDLNKLKNTLENAIIGTFFIKTKIEATQIFEYQNNRGVRPVQFELIKAYLMNQIYLVDKDEISCNAVVNEIQKDISNIYRSLEASKNHFSENDMLDIYCNLAYNIDGNIDNIKEHIHQEEPDDAANGEDDEEDSVITEDRKFNELVIKDFQTNKIGWIKSFFHNFAGLCENAEKLDKEIKENVYLSNLFLLSCDKLSWKHFLLAVWSCDLNIEKTLNRVLKYLEIICFKILLTSRKKDKLYDLSCQIYSREINFKNLSTTIKQWSRDGFEDNWDDFQNSIETYCKSGDNYSRVANETKYILWQYENKLRKGGEQPGTSKIYTGYTIEHIYPETPDENNKSALNEKYIHYLGNLALLTQSDNSKNSNKAFDEKKTLYKKYTDSGKLLMYKEILENAKWGRNTVLERHHKLVEFIQNYFDWQKVK